MKTQKLDAFLVTQLSNVRYLSGFTGTTGYLFILPRKTLFITDNRYREQAEKEVVCDEICVLTSTSLSSQVVDFVKQWKLKQLGVEGKDLSYWQYLTLQGAMPKNSRLVPCEDWIESLRQIKDELEIKLMKKAARIGDRAWSIVLKQIREGMSELDLFYLLRNALEDCGGGKLSFDAIIKFGGRCSIIHGKPGRAKLKKGQLILMDFGTTYQGYCSDMTRTVAFGEPGEKIRQAYQAVQMAQRKAAFAVRAGKRTNEIDAVARECLKQSGYGDLFLHATGHSLGIDIHEEPRVSDQSSVLLRENMVITIEPGVYQAGKFGIRIEDMVRVTPDGPDILTKSTRKLVVL